MLLGEASHGTHEFYRERARITKRLIAERGFTAVAVEGDWPDAYRVNRFVRGAGGDADAEEALRGFRRFPTWMWRNADVLDFVGWLRAHNDGLADRGARGRLLRPRPLQPRRLDGGGDRATSTCTIPTRPSGRARRYECLQPYGGESAEYGRAVLLGVERVVPAATSSSSSSSCAGARPTTCAATARVAEDEYFFAEQNAVVVADAEEYYRTMFGDRGRRRGTCATATWPTRSTSSSRTSTATAARAASSCGSTTRTSATRARPRWRGAASSTSAS